MTDERQAKKRTGRKRGNNEGSIYQRADLLWCAQITLPNGKRKYLYGKTRRDVQTKLTAALRDVDQGLPLPSAKLTLAKFLDQWLNDSAKLKRVKTYTSYEGTVRLHIAPTLGRYPLAQVTPERIQALLTVKQDAGLSPRSVAYIRTVLRIALGKAVKWNLLPRNPATLVDVPKVERHTITPLSPDQARQLLSAAKGDRLEALYTVALALGLRKGEALGLTWADVDLDGGTLRVAFQLQRIEGKRTRVLPKTDESRRTLALPDAVITAFRAHRVRQLEERLALGEGWTDTGFVFTSRIGTPLDERNVNRSFKRLLMNAGLPDMRFHDLRHSAASLLLAQGVPMRMITDLLGHTTIGTTADIYAHIAPAMRRETAAIMDKILAVAGAS